MKGKYLIDVKFPKEYPFKVPEFYLKTRICHPNVYNDT